MRPNSLALHDLRLATSLIGCLSVLAQVAAPAAELPPAAQNTVDFATEIEPLLRKNCYSCHGSEHQEGGLRLDQKKRALQGGDSGAEIVPGKSAASRLVKLIAGIDEDFGVMPPKDKGAPLTAEQVGLVRAWIDQGAIWPDDAAIAKVAAGHWSLLPVRRPALPIVRETQWPVGPIDAFTLARLEQNRVAHSASADRTTLLRRLHLDLTGLAPSPGDVAAFLDDSRPDARERLVDRLLASPHFGERWGRHWLDLARYADSDGYEKDRPRPFAWRYRDWVIAAINADLRYDTFTIEQIAGDMLPGSTIAQQAAAGFHRNTLHNTEGGIDPEEDRVKKTVDRTSTLGTVWLGLTVGCAQCHTHKYDPITQREFYSLYAFFNSIDEKDLEDLTPEQAANLEANRQAHAEQATKLKAEVDAYVAEKLPKAQAEWEAKLVDKSAEQLTAEKTPADVAAVLLRPAAERNAEEVAQLAKHYRSLDKQLAKLEKAVTDHQAKAPKVPDDAKIQAVSQVALPRVTNIHLRGDFLSPGDAVTAQTPAVLPPFVARGEMPDRLDLANWLVDPANPLTARVAANRVWQQLFGRGIVSTSDDFGKQGEKPSHPELLDWLASEFASQWSLKDLVREIVSSSTYQQSSAHRSDLIAVDPENILLARQIRRRVESEIIRDLALSASGMLTERIGGPSVRPPQPAEYASVTYAGSAKWVESQGAERNRRGMYTFFQRTSPYPMLMTFDTPDSNECAVRRQTSNTPLQALTLWNDPVFIECAQSLGRRIVREAPVSGDPRQSARQRAAYGFVLCLAREPSEEELADVLTLYDAQLRLARQDEAAARQIVGPAVLPAEANLAELAGWVAVGRTLLNLDEFIVRE